MNGIEKIIKHIMTESAGEYKAIEDESALECERIKAEYAKAEQDEYWKKLNIGTKEAERRIERLASLAALESKKQVLTTQQEMLASAFELAADKLSNLPENEYVSFLAKLAAKASISGEETVLFSPRDMKKIGARVVEAANKQLSAQGKNAALKLSEEACGIRGGLVLSGGNIEVNCSVDALVSQYKNELAPKVSEVLFG